LPLNLPWKGGISWEKLGPKIKGLNPWENGPGMGKIIKLSSKPFKKRKVFPKKEVSF